MSKSSDRGRERKEKEKKGKRKKGKPGIDLANASKRKEKKKTSKIAEFHKAERGKAPSADDICPGGLFVF